MGHGGSKPEPAPVTDENLDKYCPAHMRSLVDKHSDTVEALDASTDMSKTNSISTSSSGFHVLELHGETLGMGVGVLIGLVILVAIGVLVFKYCKARSRRLREAEASAAGLTGVGKTPRASYNNNIPLQAVSSFPTIPPPPQFAAPAPIQVAPTPIVLAPPPQTKGEALARAIAHLP